MAIVLCESAGVDIAGCEPLSPTNHAFVTRLGGIGRSPIEFHKFLRATNWRNPTDAAHTAMHAAYNTDLPNCFEYLRSVGLGPQTNHHSEWIRLRP